MDGFDAASQFCAGTLYSSDILHFVRRLNGNKVEVDLLPTTQKDNERFVGDVGICGAYGGEPAFQWARSATDNTLRAVQIGVESRGIGCSSAVNRPGVYTKVAAVRSWIRENSKDGGCDQYE